MNSEQIKQKLAHFYIIGQKPDTDWFRIFLFTLFVSILVGFWSVYFFYETQSKITTISSGTDVFIPHRRTKGDDFSDTIKRYDERAAYFQKLTDQLK